MITVDHIGVPACVRLGAASFLIRIFGLDREIPDELLGGDDARDWAFLESLGAANSPDSIEVEVAALINERDRAFRFSSPLGQVLSAGAGSVGRPPAEPYDASDSARQRLDRALQHLHSLGIRATGDIATDDAYRLVRRRVKVGPYDRVLLVLTDRRSLLAWIARRSLEARLRWVLRSPCRRSVIRSSPCRLCPAGRPPSSRRGAVPTMPP